MRRNATIGAAIATTVAVLLVGTGAHAQTPPGPPAGGPPEATEPPAPAQPVHDALAEPISPMERIHAPAPPPPSPLSHSLQANVRATVGSGVRYVFPYASTTVCGPDARRTNCVGQVPIFADLDAGFGVSDNFELTAMFRLGLTADFNGQTPMAFGFGARVYPSPRERVKLFMALRVVADVTSYNLMPAPDVPIDWAGRFEAGLQVEFVRWVGMFVQIGATAGFARWMRFEVDGGMGLQLRFP